MNDTDKKREKAKYDVDYAKKNIKRVPLDMQKDDYDKLQAAASAAGEKVNTYIKRAIFERMEREQTQIPQWVQVDPKRILLLEE